MLKQITLFNSSIKLLLNVQQVNINIFHRYSKVKKQIKMPVFLHRKQKVQHVVQVTLPKLNRMIVSVPYLRK